MAKSFPIRVDCQRGRGGEAAPNSLHFGLARVVVKDLVERWGRRDQHDFNLMGEDGPSAIVSRYLPSGLWEFGFHDSGRGPVK